MLKTTRTSLVLLAAKYTRVSVRETNSETDSAVRTSSKSGRSWILPQCPPWGRSVPIGTTLHTREQLQRRSMKHKCRPRNTDTSIFRMSAFCQGERRSWVDSTHSQIWSQTLPTVDLKRQTIRLLIQILSLAPYTRSNCMIITYLVDLEV